MSKIIIFGTLDTAELAHYYLTNDSEHDVIGFALHSNFLTTSKFKGLPVFEFESLCDKFTVDQIKLFAPLTARKMNTIRKNVYLEGKSKGYKFISYISSKATTFGNEIGENCFILENNVIQPFTSIGNNVVLWSGNHIGHHSKIEDHVFFTSHVVMSGNCVIGSQSFLGVNSTIRDQTNLAEGTLLAMGSSLVMQQTEKWGVYIGNPAKKKKALLSYEVY